MLIILKKYGNVFYFPEESSSNFTKKTSTLLLIKTKNEKSFPLIAGSHKFDSLSSVCCPDYLLQV